MGGNKQVTEKPTQTELPKPVFTKDTGTKDDMFINSFKAAVEGGIKIAESESNKR